MKKILSVIIVLTMLAAFVPCAFAATIVASGECGENLTWTLDNEGTLKISGTGEMENYDSWKNYSPWYAHRSSVKAVKIESDVTSISGYAFYGCSLLTSITIPNSVTSIGMSAFGGTAWYNAQSDGLVYAGKVAYTYKGAMPANTSVTLLDGTTGIADSAFRDCELLTSITIPSSVRSIGYDAFSYCFSLASITIPDGVTSIGVSAFSSCIALESITIPGSVTSIGVSAFSGCTALISIGVAEANTLFMSQNGILFDKEQKTLIQYPAGKAESAYVIPNGVTSIGDEAFSSCTALESVTIPNSVKSIGNDAFFCCNWLENVIIGAGVTSIGDCAFMWCSSLASITIPDSVTSIGNSAFGDCTTLESITIPDRVTSIGMGAFSGCESLENITIPSSVTSIGDNAFSDCTNLTLRVYDGSYGAQYAQDNSVPYVLFIGELAQAPTGKVYGDGNATVRFSTTAYPESGREVEYYGTYIIPKAIFESEGGGDSLMLQYDASVTPIESGKTFGADVRNIPPEYFDEPLYAWSYIKYTDSEAVETEEHPTAKVSDFIE